MAEVDLTKLTKLESLKQLAERVNDDFATKESLTEVDGKVTALEGKVSGLETASKDYAKSADVEKDYLKKSDAENTYLSQTEAESTYLTQANAANTYATKADVSSVYKPSGSKASVTELDEPSADILGNVYNMTAEFTTNDKFIESEVGNKYPKGTNVVVIEVTNDIYKYDVLAGFVDLADYEKTSDMESYVQNELEGYYDKDSIDAMIASNKEVESMLDEVFNSN